MSNKTAKIAAEKFLHGHPFKSGNVAVIVQENVAQLSLFGNVIASRVNHTSFVITTAGWNTVSTKRYLNALPGVKVKTAGYKLTLNDKEWDGNWTTINY